METGSTMLELAADALGAFDPAAVAPGELDAALAMLSRLSAEVEELRSQLEGRP
jgi:hypothetical protein